MRTVDYTAIKGGRRVVRRGLITVVGTLTGQTREVEGVYVPEIEVRLDDGDSLWDWPTNIYLLRDVIAEMPFLERWHWRFREAVRAALLVLCAKIIMCLDRKKSTWW